jgi:hypothetical protein
MNPCPRCKGRKGVKWVNADECLKASRAGLEVKPVYEFFDLCTCDREKQWRASLPRPTTAG